MAIKKSIYALKVEVTVDCVEHLFVAVQINNWSGIIGGTYIPPASSSDTYDQHCKAIEQISCDYPGWQLILVGDYNLPGVKWGNDDLGVTVNCSPMSPATVLAESFAYLNLHRSQIKENGFWIWFLQLYFSVM